MRNKSDIDDLSESFETSKDKHNWKMMGELIKQFLGLIMKQI